MIEVKKVTTKTQIPRFAEGQRVKVVLLRNYGELRYRLPEDYSQCDGKIGYVMTSRADSFPIKSLRLWIQCYGYEVIMTRTADILSLPEDCLELAECQHEVS
jgi:hypothetical protein